LNTTIGYSLTIAGNIRLSLIDIGGREISIISDEYRSAGTYEVEFETGELSAGLYLCRMIQGSHIITNQMVITK
jgi:hypothetical protein